MDGNQHNSYFNVRNWSMTILLFILSQGLIDVVFKLKYANYGLLNDTLEFFLAILVANAVYFSWGMVEHSGKFKKDTKRFFKDTSIRLIYFLTIALLLFLLGRLLYYSMLSEGAFLTWRDEVLRISVFGIYMIVVFGLMVSVEVTQQWKISTAALGRAEKANAEFQLEMLKTQVNPHFLFNNLNTLSGLIRVDSQKANEFLNQLSHVYRAILQNRAKNFLTLEEELENFIPYKRMMETRFEERLFIQIDDLNTHLKKMIPALSLQILTENAIKHNTLTQNKPLTVSIIVKDDRLWMSNPMQLKREKEFSSKIGLNNIRQRLNILTEVDLQIESTDEEFRVGIPLIDGL